MGRKMYGTLSILKITINTWACCKQKEASRKQKTVQKPYCESALSRENE